MDYDSIDWEAEAKRVTRAFGVVEECEFVLADTESDIEFMELIQKNRQNRRCVTLEAEQSTFLFCGYGEDGLRGFAVGLNGDEGEIQVHIELERDGGFYSEVIEKQYSEVLAKGLFHLDLLSPEVETALKLSVSAHQKLEWTQEYETRYGI